MDAATAQRLNAELQVHVTALQEIAKKLNSLVGNRGIFMSQLHENEMVSKEFSLLKESNKVYKLNGPVLVRQDFSEAKSTVNNRIKHFQSKIDEIDKTEIFLTGEQQKHRDEINKIQETAKQIQQATVTKQTALTDAAQLE